VHFLDNDPAKGRTSREVWPFFVGRGFLNRKRQRKIDEK
jgi:hypothetical protein